MDKTYKFHRSYGASGHTFYIREDSISIVGSRAGGGGTLKLSDDEKFDLVAEAATARDIFTMRTLGFVEVADRVRLIQLINRPAPPTSPWTRRRRPNRFAETRGQRVVSLDLFRKSG